MNKLRVQTGRTFRFPFDIDRRFFLILSALFFILSIKPINSFFIPRMNHSTIENKIKKDLQKRRTQFKKSFDKLKHDGFDFSTYNTKTLDHFKNKPWTFFIYNKDSLQFWSQAATKSQNVLQSKYNVLIPYEKSGEQGVYIKKKEEYQNKNYTLLVEFPLYKKYNVENEHFKSHFTFLKSNGSLLEDFGYELKTLTSSTSKDEIVTTGDFAQFELS